MSGLCGLPLSMAQRVNNACLYVGALLIPPVKDLPLFFGLFFLRSMTELFQGCSAPLADGTFPEHWGALHSRRATTVPVVSTWVRTQFKVKNSKKNAWEMPEGSHTTTVPRVAAERQGPCPPSPGLGLGPAVSLRLGWSHVGGRLAPPAAGMGSAPPSRSSWLGRGSTLVEILVDF